MASKKQIEANRRNAQKSTGPKTEEGKAKSSMNALKHGLTSRTVCLPEEDADQYMEVRILLAEELRPWGALETILVNRIAAQSWRLSRVPGIEAEMLERLRYDGLGQDEGLAGAWLRDGSPYGGSLARLSRYETALERSISRLLKELRQLQAERARREREDAARPGEEDAWTAGPDGRLMDPVAAEEAWERALEGGAPMTAAPSGVTPPQYPASARGETGSRGPTHPGSDGGSIMAW